MRSRSGEGMKDSLGKEQKGPGTEHEGLGNKGVKKGWLGKKDMGGPTRNQSVEGWDELVNLSGEKHVYG